MDTICRKYFFFVNVFVFRVIYLIFNLYRYLVRSPQYIHLQEFIYTIYEKHDITSLGPIYPSIIQHQRAGRNSISM